MSIYAEYLENWLCDTGLLISRGSRCCICCFCLSPVGGWVLLVEGFLFFLYERSRNKKLLSTSKTSFWLGFGRATSAGVCQRVARCRCSENIPDDILTEILAQQVVIRNIESLVILELFEKRTLSTLSKTTTQAWGDVDWVAVWEAWVGSGLLPEATPFQEKGEEQRCLLPWFSIWQLFCWARLSYTQPFRHSVVDGDGVYTGGRGKKNLFLWKEKNIFLSGDDQGVLEYRKMTTNTCIRQVLFHSMQMISIINLQKHDCFASINFNNHWRTDLGDGNVQKICLMPTFGLVRRNFFNVWIMMGLTFGFCLWYIDGLLGSGNDKTPWK